MRDGKRLKIRYPECDVRHCMSLSNADISEYTMKRIINSYESVDNILSRCDGLSVRKMLDIGCGSGFDSFAFGRYFDNVLAIDKSRQAIAEAKRIAKSAKVSNVAFKCMRTEHFFPSRQFDFVFCNLMSHNVNSRRELLRLISGSINSHGWLFYSEVTEGYPMMEIHRAILRRDGRELVNRMYQVVRGFIGKSGFRFFISGTGGSQLESLGLQVVGRKVEAWNGVPFSEYLLCNKVEGPSEKIKGLSDIDYYDLPDQFAKIRYLFNEYLSSRPAKGFTEVQRLRISRFAEDTSNRFAPFSLVLLMLDIVKNSVLPFSLFSGRTGLVLLTRVIRSLDESDWVELNELSRCFIKLTRAVSGLDENVLQN